MRIFLTLELTIFFSDDMLIFWIQKKIDIFLKKEILWHHVKLEE